MNFVQNKFSIMSVLVDATVANNLLLLNTKNRPINVKRVNSLSVDLQEGRFFESGSGVSVSKAGVLLDGQHRLSAIVVTGIPRQMAVAVGCEEEAQMALGDVQPRSFGQQLGIDGYKNSTRLGSACRRIAAFIAGGDRTHRSSGELKKYFNTYANDLQHTITLVGPKHRAEIHGALALARSVHGFKSVVDDFGQRFHDMTFNGKGDPVRALYAHISTQSSAGGHDELFERTLAAVAAFKNGVSMERTRVSRDTNSFFKERALKP